MIADLIQRYTQPFIRLSDAELTAVADRLRRRHYDKRARITDIGEQEEYIHFIVKGLARRYFYDRNEEKCVQIAKEGELIFSITSFFTGQRSPDVIETIEPAELYSLHKDDMEALCSRYPRLNTLCRLILTQVFIQKDMQYRKDLTGSLPVRFKDFMNTQKDLLQRVPQKILASYLNIKPETFSRLKHLMRGKQQETENKSLIIPE